MSSTILFVFEGEKTESELTSNLTQYFVNENSYVECAFCSDIYQLYHKLCADDDLDTFAILKSRPQNVTRLAPYKRSDFAEIYMFFDYDGHAPIADDNIIADLLKFFDEETDLGKLYISYPMVEAVKHLSQNFDFKDLKVPAKTKINYKLLVEQEGASHLKCLRELTEADWKELLEAHIKKMSFIVDDNYDIPMSLVNQFDIFSKQLEKYIGIDSTVAVLSAFPLFLFDYYGVAYISDLLSSD